MFLSHIKHSSLKGNIHQNMDQCSFILEAKTNKGGFVQFKTFLEMKQLGWSHRFLFSCLRERNAKSFSESSKFTPRNIPSFFPRYIHSRD